jgi:hypothetical protein
MKIRRKQSNWQLIANGNTLPPPHPPAEARQPGRGLAALVRPTCSRLDNISFIVIID